VADTGNSKLARQPAPVALAFEVFDLRLDDGDRAAMAADPASFLRRLIESETDAPINGLMIDEKLLDGDAGAITGPVIYHCLAPPEMASKYLTVLTS